MRKTIFSFSPIKAHWKAGDGNIGYETVKAWRAELGAEDGDTPVLSLAGEIAPFAVPRYPTLPHSLTLSVRFLSAALPRFPMLSLSPVYRSLAYLQYIAPSSVSSLFAFPSVPHSRAALATRTPHVPDPGGHPYQVSRCTEACATIFDHLRPTNLVPVPDLAALARGFNPSTPTRSRSPRTPIRHLAPRRGLRDMLRRFAPPNPAHTLRLFPSA
ncbi:hypothetical protein EDB84DRAFT_1598566 [Lactarius hengduanensis]|nr:hypothetical protein EDB84DRAFT_1598566 [Lactarius hengduanensis]